MTDDNSNLVDMENLDNFSETFFGTGEPSSDPEPEAPEAEDEEQDEASTEIGDDTPATDADEDAHTEEEPDEDEDLAEEEEEEKPEPQKKGKKSAKERIEELYAANKTMERELAALKAAREAPEVEVKTETTTPAASDEPVQGPKPDDLDEDGEPKYALGEFDPKFIRDLTRFTIDEERKAAKAEEEAASQKRQIEAAQEELKSSWLSKVEEAEKELPDLREHLADMGTTFAHVDPGYGEFLAATIMSCDFGPQIMYYLSQNIGEAQKIVASGPAAATLAIGRLDAKFTKSPQEEKRNTKKVSNAPNPPENRNRGSGTKTTVAGDTSDLNAFEREFFGKGK